MTDLDLGAADLRRRLHELADTLEPAADAWDRLLSRLVDPATPVVATVDTIDPAVDGPDRTVVVELADVAVRRRSRRRPLQAVAAVAAAVLAVGLGVVLPRLGGNDLAAAGEVPWFVLGEGATGYELRSAVVGGDPVELGYSLLLGDGDGRRGYLVRTSPSGSSLAAVTDGVAPATTAAGSFAGGRIVSVNGQEAVIAGGGTSASNSVTWNIGANVVSVDGFGQATAEAELLAVAEGLTVDDAGVPTAGVVPAGLSVRASGTNADLAPTTRYVVDYGAENLDAAFDDGVQIAVTTGGEPAFTSVLYGTLTPGVGRSAEVRGHTATVRTVDDGANRYSTVVWQEAKDVSVAVVGAGLTEDATLDLVRNLRVLDEAAWRAAVAPRLGAGGDPPGVGDEAPVVATGAVGQGRWELRAADTAPQGGDVCFSLTGPDAFVSGCLPAEPGALGVIASESGPGVVWLVVRADEAVTTVVLRDGSGNEVDRVATASATAVGGRYAVLRRAAEPASGTLRLEGLAADGTVRATGSYDFAPAGAGYPDTEAIASAPVVASGELEGRPWRARAAVVRRLTTDRSGDVTAAPGEAILCVTVDYAARPLLGVVCAEQASAVPGTLGAAVFESPRRFVAAVLPASATALVVGWADGSSTAVAPSPVDGAGGRTVAVVAVPRGARVVSVEVPGSGAGPRDVDVPGDPAQAVRFGGSTG